jgi:hypothetical protein
MEKEKTAFKAAFCIRHREKQKAETLYFIIYGICFKQKIRLQKITWLRFFTFPYRSFISYSRSASQAASILPES